jgi:LuxR family transcriptional regulator, maltose regulon positive regulatory protein
MDPGIRPGTAGAPVPVVWGATISRHALFKRLTEAARVTQISAPAGSGKTILLRSWIREAGLADRVAWLTVQGEERDPQRFWIAVADALRGTDAGAALVRPLTVAPDLDGWAIVERLLADLSSLRDRIWLVVTDLHELTSAEALRQLELLVLRAPHELRFVLGTRHDLHLGLHRLRLEGQLTEIRAADLRFTVDEARALFDAAGIWLSQQALELLYSRTEGWAAGLRLAALSLAGRQDPDRFAAEFCGSERTVAEYLVAEVLGRQCEEVRRLLLRTSVLERVNGPLADLLTEGSGGERILQDLEAAGAFVFSLDAARSWFRYHPLFADLLQLELRRTAQGELPVLHGAAAGWYAEHGYPVEAIRHAQAARDWRLAARLLSEYWFSLLLNGQAATAHKLATEFPADVVTADAELAAVLAADELDRGSLPGAERYLTLATRGAASVTPGRRRHLEVMLAVLRIWLAREHGDLPAVVEEADRLLVPAEVADAARLGRGEDLRALALMNLGIAELWSLRAQQAQRHLEQGAELARRIGRPYLEVGCLAHLAVLGGGRGHLPADPGLGGFALGEDQSLRAIELVRRHGWSEEPVAAVAYLALGSSLLWQGRLKEAEQTLERAGLALRAEAEPAAGLMLHYARGLLEQALGHDEDALATFHAAERLTVLLVPRHPLVTRMRAIGLATLVRMGETEEVEQAFAQMDEQQRETAYMCTALAALRLAQHDERAATTALVTVLDGSAPGTDRGWMILASLLEAIALDTAGNLAAAARALESGLDLAAPDHAILPFLTCPAPALLERQSRHRTAHAALISETLIALAQAESVGPQGSRWDSHAGQQTVPGRHVAGQARHSRPMQTALLTESETRVLRYLPTNLSASEIAAQLSLSANTVRTHIRHLYDKLCVHRRGDAVEQARALGLLAPSARGSLSGHQKPHRRPPARPLVSCRRRPRGAPL